MKIMDQKVIDKIAKRFGIAPKQSVSAWDFYIFQRMAMAEGIVDVNNLLPKEFGGVHEPSYS
jgi:hypothetical protein